MIDNKRSPIKMYFKKSTSSASTDVIPLTTFNSYSFERNILVPASAFRFTAPGVDKALRMKIRSGDTVTLWCEDINGNKQQISTGFIDETDTHVTNSSVEYILTGRDTIGQLVDNAAVDANNRIIIIKSSTLKTLFSTLLLGTRMPQGFPIDPQLPNGNFLVQTNPGETKISALQRYLELANCLIWTLPDGRANIGKPNFTQTKSGDLILNSNTSNPKANNVLEARSRRNVNQAIRKIVTQLQTLSTIDPTPMEKTNNDDDMKEVSSARVGRSVFNCFTYGQGTALVNQIIAVGNQSASPRDIGNELSSREIARENMKILDVEMVVKGHLNSNGDPYNIDQIYSVKFEDDDIDEDMYVYSCSYELTMNHGMLTRLRLCRLHTICAYTYAISRKTS